MSTSERAGTRRGGCGVVIGNCGMGGQPPEPTRGVAGAGRRWRVLGQALGRQRWGRGDSVRDVDDSDGDGAERVQISSDSQHRGGT